jgi:tetratricopeptide (TPR) repeat protein
MRSNVLWFLAFSAALAVASSAEARRRRGGDAPAETPPPPDPAQATAREHYDHAKALFDEGKFEEALTEFQAAYDARPHPIVLLSLAECLERLERWGEAAQKLDLYLRASPDAHDKTEVEGRIARLRAHPARVHVVSTPSGASIRIDGESSGQTTPADVEMPGGEHDLALSLEGYDDASEHVTVEGAETREVSVTLTEAAAAPPPPEGEEEEGGGRGGSSSAVWIFGGITGVALVGGTVLGFMALSDQSEFDDHPSQEIKDRGERMALFADVAFGLALAAGVTTIVLALSGGEEEREDPAAARLRLGPLALSGGAGLSLSGAY